MRVIVALVVGLAATEGPAQTVDCEAGGRCSPPIVDVREIQSKRPEVLVLGDSQISYGAGQVFQEFFSDLDARCGRGTGLSNAQVAAIGVRSSALHSWTARGDRGKGVICDVDKKHGVNAGTYGINTPTGRSYVQIGQGAAYPFCRSNTSPLEALYSSGRYQPELLVLSFLGNAVDRWANNPAKAVEDVEATLAQIPPGQRCIFMTTAPSYDRTLNDRRLQAQTAAERAFAQVGQQCTFVRGFTAQTRSDNEGNGAHFTANASGRVTDPHHPNIRAARAFFDSVGPQICAAVHDEMGG